MQSKPYLSLPQHREHNVQCSGTSMHPPACLCFGRPQGTEGYSALTTQPVKNTPRQEEQHLITVAHRLSEHRAHTIMLIVASRMGARKTFDPADKVECAAEGSYT